MDLIISTAPRRFAKKWKPKTVTWEALADKLSQTVRTSETAAEYRHMSKPQRDQVKDVGGFVGGWLKDGIRKKGHVVSRYLVTLDADNADADFLPHVAEGLAGYTYVVYSTHSHTPDEPRYRVIIPLRREVSAEEYQALARKLASFTGPLDAYDDTTYEPERLMYWPSTPKDVDYVYIRKDGELIDPDRVLSLYPDWRDTSLWPTSTREAEVPKHVAATKQGDPLQRPGLIGAFNRAHDIDDAIETFLSDVYTAGTIPHRYTYRNGTTTNGLVVYEDGKFAYSHHATDPACGQLCNSFDLVRIHLFGKQDENTAPDTPTTKKPSYEAMQQFIRNDQPTMEEYRKESSEKLKQTFEAKGVEDADMSWMNSLVYSGGKFPKIASVPENYLMIMLHDPLLKGRVGEDLFSHRYMVLKKMPWVSREPVPRPWSDYDDSELRLYISTNYDHITNKQHTSDALDSVMSRNAFHPVKDYLKSLTWDGIKRAETLFIDHLGAKDTKYTRAVTRIQLLATVARVMRPGIKYDQCLVLVGAQGIGKSRILRALGGDWYSDSIVSFTGKDPMVQLQGHTIIELSEMQASNKAENDQIKAFISRQVDKFRMPYGRRTAEFPRTCTFWGTTNDYVFLRDRTGGRRFWPVYCEGIPGGFKGLTKDDVGQIWAEVLTWYKDATKDGKKLKLLLQADIAKEAAEIQAEHTEGAEKLGIIKAYLDKKLPKGWDDMDIYERREYLRSYGPEDEATGKERNSVCNLELWCEAFEQDPNKYISAAGREYNALMMQIKGWTPVSCIRTGKLYGRQRGFKRVSVDG